MAAAAAEQALLDRVRDLCEEEDDISVEVAEREIREFGFKARVVGVGVDLEFCLGWGAFPGAPRGVAAAWCSTC